ncbi:MAG: hypothetical protein ACM3QU_00130 [Verrucomicrobiota bacterium]
MAIAQRGRYPKTYPHTDPNEDIVACAHDDPRTILAVAAGHNGLESSEARSRLGL